MMQRELSKLQIRAEAMTILQSLSTYNTIPQEAAEFALTTLKTIANKDYLLDLLLKEMNIATENRAKVIGFLLIQLSEGSEEKIKAALWANIKNPQTNDDLKNFSSVILGSLGEYIDAEKILSYYHNPDEAIEKETSKLLEIASFNPEAQLDFLDFLFSIPFADQQELINSLREDYALEDLVNILMPVVESGNAIELNESIINILGEVKSYKSVQILKDIYNYSKNEKHKSLANKNLKMLKLTGLDIENYLEFIPLPDICNRSKPYLSICCPIDGKGNQGFIISRKSQDDNIYMMSVVINDLTGIVDCFGFFEITITDFNKIVTRFKEYSLAIEVPIDYCKTRLVEAELINKTNNTKIAYEYVVWKAIVADVKPMNLDYNFVEELNNINYDVKDIFNQNFAVSWFVTEEEFPVLDEVFNSYFKEIAAKDLIKNQTELIKLSEKIEKEIIELLFDENLVKIYSNRLVHQAYFFELEGDVRHAKTTMYSARQILTDNSFFKTLTRKSIIEALKRHDAKKNEQKEVKNLFPSAEKLVQLNNSRLKKQEISDYDYSEVVEMLAVYWFRN